MESKLDQLADIEGMDVMEMLEEGTYDSVCWGICMNPDCSYTIQVEPDCDSGFCEACGTNTVKSALILAELI